MTRPGTPGLAGGGFAHLHVRSGFSYGLGTATPEELAGTAMGMGYPAMALTDRDGLYGMPRFLAACGEQGLSPVVGAEVTVELGAGHRGHVVLLAASGRGYRSLCRLLTAYLLPEKDGSWPSAAERRNPACPLRTLLEHAGGDKAGGDLVCLTGAIPFGLVPSLALSRDAGLRGKAGRVLDLVREAFGEGNVFVELSDDGTEGSRGRMRVVGHLAERRGLPTVAAGEVTYLRPRGHRLSEALAAARSLSPLPPPGYRPTDRLYLRPPGEMGRLFSDRPEALENAREIAERCGGGVDLLGRGVLVPSANLSAGATQDGTLAHLALAGARRLYPAAFRGEAGSFPSEKELRARLKRELRVISAQRFSGYFLIAREAAELARSLGTPVTGRGSAANSLVARCVGLTTPCPFAHRLLFERFLHEGRRDPPDVDIDLCSERRDLVRDELMQRHRSAGAAVAATASTLSLRGAVRVAARALGYPPSEIDTLARNVPRRVRDRDKLVNYTSEWGAALSSPPMKGHPLQDRERFSLLLDLAENLEGKLHQPGTHLGGVVFGTADTHLSEIVPLEPSGKEGLVRCQFDKNDLNLVGLPKLDLLGLKTHTALDKAARMVSERLGRKVEPLALPPDDKETYRLIRSGDTAGVFQLESPGQMNLQRRLDARRMPHIVAGISLFRPGPLEANMVSSYVARKSGRERVSYPLAEIEEILRDTYGVLIYQESVLEIANKIAGFTLAEGDQLRRAMTRDRGGGAGAMREARRGFVDRATARGVPSEAATEVFGWMEGFGRYGFSAAHAASFAEISYASAYMMAHWPAETMAGLLDSQPMGFYSPRVLLNEARRKGLKILSPDLHISGEGFAVEEDGRALRPGLSYCRGLSERALSSILSERERSPFASAADLYRRTPVKQDALVNLIRAGFLDRLHPRADRAALLDQTRGLPQKRRASPGTQRELSLPHPASWWESREGRGPVVTPISQPATEPERWEARVLGLNLRRHPLSAHREALRALGVVPGRELRDLPDGTRARAAGVLECLQAPPIRSGALVHFLLTEDESGLLQSTIFERCYRRFGHVLYETDAYVLDGRVEQSEGRGFSFLVDRIFELERTLAAGPRSAGSAEPGRRTRRRPGAA